MIPVFLDFESFWSTDHSLTKMSPIAYVMHPETEIISVAYRFGNDDATYVLFGEDNIKAWAKGIDWSDKLVIGHNMSGFDSMICAWRLGIKPKMWGCTLAMARLLGHGKTTGLSLAKLVEHYMIGVKDNSALVNTKGRHLKDFTYQERAQMEEYNRADTNQCYRLFRILSKRVPADELKLIDMTIRMLVEPRFRVDMPLLEKTLDEERKRKSLDLFRLSSQMGHTALDEEDAVEFVRANLASANKFADLLRGWGVEPPMKISKTTGKETYALAKTDEEFLALQDHSHPLVSAAARARLDVKSTLLETRIEAFLQAARALKGRLPITLNYYGADTTGRWSGWAYNPQNLPRIPRDKEGNIVYKPTNALRQCMRAAPGFKVVVADLSGIELRVNHFLWKVPSSMALYQADPEKADLYKDFASKLYDIPVSDVSKNQRQVGKVAHLGLGFGAGAATFQKVAKLMGGVDLTLDESKDVVDKWRSAYPEIAQGWKTCHAALPYILSGEEGYPIDPWGLCTTTSEGIKTPRGMILYPSLRKETDEDGKQQWMYGEGRHKAKLYSGKICENVVQHLARCVLADNMLEIKRRTGRNPVHSVHDELIFLVPEAEAAAHLAVVQDVMRTPPKWWPELVTWSEGDLADDYGSAK